MMTATALPPSRYETRVERVKKIVLDNTKLSEEKARELAVQMVHALDTVPEKMR
jgi:hypothetical protein